MNARMACMERFDERMFNGMGVFAAIVRSGSFAAAAAQLDMSQPGVSRAIARLEARLGIRLFERSARAVRLTEEGWRFHAQTAPLLAGLEEAAATAAGAATTVRGHLRVNVDPYFSRLILGPQLESFMARHPDLQLELATRPQLGDMLSEGMDLALRFGEPPTSSLVARKLLDTRILTVAAPAYLARHGHPVRPQELADGRHVCIEFRDPQTGRPFPWEFHRRGRRIVVPTGGRLVLNDAGTLHSVCIAGYGIAQMMDLGAGELLASGALVALFPDWADERFPLYALYPSREHLPSKTRAFLDFVVELTQEHRA